MTTPPYSAEQYGLKLQHAADTQIIQHLANLTRELMHQWYGNIKPFDAIAMLAQCDSLQGVQRGAEQVRDALLENSGDLAEKHQLINLLRDLGSLQGYLEALRAVEALSLSNPLPTQENPENVQQNTPVAAESTQSHPH